MWKKSLPIHARYLRCVEVDLVNKQTNCIKQTNKQTKQNKNKQTNKNNGNNNITALFAYSYFFLILFHFFPVSLHACPMHVSFADLLFGSWYL